ncbi:hypothetical protein GCM10010151_55000 [Actinoallomurus spadix]|uniref:Uncharacterized protein n=1 Tax=Actinoallomurus spadix TaxID=79912 RepID=A0ABN0X952_9ACTN
MGRPQEVTLFLDPSFSEWRAAYDVQITVIAHGGWPAARTPARRWLSPGVTHKALTFAADKVDGGLLPPPSTRGRRPAVLLFGGSDGYRSG